jgi:hypothetical protein
MRRAHSVERRRAGVRHEQAEEAGDTCERRQPGEQRAHLLRL